jgi:hypothetical protein
VYPRAAFHKAPHAEKKCGNACGGGKNAKEHNIGIRREVNDRSTEYEERECGAKVCEEGPLVRETCAFTSKKIGPIELFALHCPSDGNAHRNVVGQGCAARRHARDGEGRGPRDRHGRRSAGERVLLEVAVRTRYRARIHAFRIPENGGARAEGYFRWNSPYIYFRRD